MKPARGNNRRADNLWANMLRANNGHLWADSLQADNLRSGHLQANSHPVNTAKSNSRPSLKAELIDGRDISQE